MANNHLDVPTLPGPIRDPEGVVTPDEWWAAVDADGHRRPDPAAAPAWLMIAPIVEPRPGTRDGRSL
jgi:hypothetical protein